MMGQDGTDLKAESGGVNSVDTSTEPAAQEHGSCRGCPSLMLSTPLASAGMSLGPFSRYWHLCTVTMS